MKPARLKKRDTVAVISPSWSGPGVFPKVHEEGVKALESLGLRVKEYPMTRADPRLSAQNPKLRAKDVNDAFADKNVKAIICSIGGDDSIRLLPYLDRTIIRANPKILMGYSDNTILTVYCNQLGLVTYNGPTVMAGFSQWKNMPVEFREHVKAFMLSPPSTYQYKPFTHYSEGYPDWSKEENIGKRKGLQRTDGWHWLQGEGKVQGELFGGCIEVLEFMKGTRWWPSRAFWKGKILFLETSEDKPSVQNIKYMLRNYGAQGVYESVRAVLFGRARDYTTEEKKQLDDVLLQVIREEYKSNIPIVSNMDFGHTDPQYIMPLGVKAEVDCKKRTLRLVEAPTK